MSVSTRDAVNALKPVSAIRWRDGVLRSINAGKIRDAAGVLRTFFTSMLVSVNNLNPTGYEYGLMPTTVTTSSDTNVSVAGGTTPYTYSWERLSGDVAVTADSPTAASTRFSALVGIGSFTTAIFECTVSDTSGATAKVQVTVYLENVEAT